jgi:hypothetical protein
MANIAEERIIALAIVKGVVKGAGLLIDNNKELYFN